MADHPGRVGPAGRLDPQASRGVGRAIRRADPRAALQAGPPLTQPRLEKKALFAHNPSRFLKDCAMPHSSRETARSLFSRALEQGGYFTAKQAREAGYDYPHLDYHVSTGNFERVEHGLYRLISLPPGEHDDLVRLTLWSRNRQDEPQAVVS